MKKYILLLCICFAINLGSKAQSKIGYVSIDDILTVMPEKIKGDSLLNNFQKELEVDYNANEKALDDMVAKFVKDSVKMSTTDKNIRKNLLNKKYTDLNILKEKYNQLVELENEKIQQPVTQKLLDVIKVYAKDNGFTIILHSSTAVGVTPENEITQKIKSKLGLK
jgi:outer membrane protein